MNIAYDENIDVTFRDIIRDAIEFDSRIPEALLVFREYITWRALSAWAALDTVRKEYFDVRDSKAGDYYITRHTWTKVVGIVPKNYKYKPWTITLPLLRQSLESFEPTRELLAMSRETHGR